MSTSGLSSFAYSNIFQIRQILVTKPTFFPGNKNPFSIKPSTVVWFKISEKKHQFSWSEISLPFPSGRNNCIEISTFDATWGIFI